MNYSRQILKKLKINDQNLLRDIDEEREGDLNHILNCLMVDYIEEFKQIKSKRGKNEQVINNFLHSVKWGTFDRLHNQNPQIVNNALQFLNRHVYKNYNNTLYVSHFDQYVILFYYNQPLFIYMIDHGSAYDTNILLYNQETSKSHKTHLNNIVKILKSNSMCASVHQYYFH
jgi:hypothetical protein